MREMTANPKTNYAEVGDLRRQMMTITGRLEEHNELEETQAYQWAEFFDPQTVADLGKRIQHELKNLPARLTKS
jgi:hypothetical protein